MIHPEQPLPRWLELARELQAIGQTGLAFSTSGYDIGRYRRVAEIAAALFAEGAGLDSRVLAEQFLSQPGYATPKVDVRGAIVRDNQVLLVRERSDGRWCLPGGWADVGETPSEMVIREVWEECRLTIAPTHLIGIFDGNRSQEPLAAYHAYKLIFLCEIVSGEPAPGDEEIVAVGWFRFDALPELSANRTDTRHLAAVRSFASGPDERTMFD
jgi:ADP-ribose pyrophosphatase YjhB (NUDIX family)